MARCDERVIDDRGILPPAEVADVGAQIAAVLAAARAAGSGIAT